MLGCCVAPERSAGVDRGVRSPLRDANSELRRSNSCAARGAKRDRETAGLIGWTKDSSSNPNYQTGSVGNWELEAGFATTARACFRLFRRRRATSATAPRPAQPVARPGAQGNGAPRRPRRGIPAPASLALMPWRILASNLSSRASAKRQRDRCVAGWHSYGSSSPP